jgi:hypothetical protein
MTEGHHYTKIAICVRTVPSVQTMGYGLDERRIVAQFPAGAEALSFLTVSYLALDLAEPLMQWIPG